MDFESHVTTTTIGEFGVDGHFPLNLIMHFPIIPFFLIFTANMEGPKRGTLIEI